LVPTVSVGAVAFVGVQTIIVLVPLPFAVPEKLPLDTVMFADVTAFIEIVFPAVAVKGRSAVMKI
jgi:hypothetical protein